MDVASILVPKPSSTVGFPGSGSSAFRIPISFAGDLESLDPGSPIDQPPITVTGVDETCEHRNFSFSSFSNLPHLSVPPLRQVPNLVGLGGRRTLRAFTLLGHAGRLSLREGPLTQHFRRSARSAPSPDKVWTARCRSSFGHPRIQNNHVTITIPFAALPP
jgi:hypothetical protein